MTNCPFEPMARTRNIKPGFFDNEILGGLPALTRLLFIGLWGIADRDGRLEDRPPRIKKEVLGYDPVSVGDVDKMLQALHGAGFIARYAVDGQKYIQVVSFSKHQYPNAREKPSTIPPPAETVAVVEMACAVEKDPPPKTPEAPKETKTTQEERFDTFWAAYPRKVGKKAARASWKSAKVTEELFGKIMAAVAKAKKSVQWQRENGQFIPNPATWLNQGRWDDEDTETTETPLESFETEEFIAVALAKGVGFT